MQKFLINFLWGFGLCAAILAVGAILVLATTHFKPLALFVVIPCFVGLLVAIVDEAF